MYSRQDWGIETLFDGKLNSASIWFGLRPRLGFWHDEEIERKPNNSDAGKRKCRAITGMDDNNPGKRGGQSGTDAYAGKADIERAIPDL
jgi:hypothetical protein